MRVLFVSNPGVIHTARWIEQLTGLGWDLELFSPYATSELTINPETPLEVRIHLIVKQNRSPIRQTGFPYPFEKGDRFRLGATRLYEHFRSRPEQLANLIDKLQPDVIHSLEMQGATYLTLEAKKILEERGQRFPPWIYSCWGSDIYLFGKDPVHDERIRETLSQVDYLIVDCERDIGLARDFGFMGKLLGNFPTGGGFEIDKLRQRYTEVSERRVIAVKGFVRDGQGRAMLALDAIERCAPELADHEIVVYMADDAVAERALAIGREKGITVSVFPPSPHEEFVALLSKSKLSIAINASDGSPNTMLESMIVGAFPIQSDTGSTREWIKDGLNGFLVHPDDGRGLAEKIRMALNNSDLLQDAAVYNYEFLRAKLGRDHIRQEVIDIYHFVASNGKRSS